MPHLSGGLRVSHLSGGLRVPHLSGGLKGATFEWGG